MRSRQLGRLYEIPILFFLLLLLGTGFANYGLGWRALILPSMLIALFGGLALIGMTLGAIGHAWTRWRMGRALDRLVAGAPAEPIVAALRRDLWLLPAEALKRERLFELASQPGPSRPAILGLLLRSSDTAVKDRLRPLLRARLEPLEEPEFPPVLSLFHREDDKPAIAAALLARASPDGRRKLLKDILADYGGRRSAQGSGSWVRQWTAIVAPYRDDLLALRDPARTLDVEAIDALTR